MKNKNISLFILFLMIHQSSYSMGLLTDTHDRFFDRIENYFNNQFKQLEEKFNHAIDDMKKTTHRLLDKDFENADYSKSSKTEPFQGTGFLSYFSGPDTTTVFSGTEESNLFVNGQKTRTRITTEVKDGVKTITTETWTAKKAA